jgi:hypothetical protein
LIIAGGVAIVLLAAVSRHGAAQDAPPDAVGVDASAEQSDAPYDATHAQQLLQAYCYGCHGGGASEGNLALDELMAKGELMDNPKRPRRTEVRSLLRRFRRAVLHRTAEKAFKKKLPMATCAAHFNHPYERYSRCTWLASPMPSWQLPSPTPNPPPRPRPRRSISTPPI